LPSNALLFSESPITALWLQSPASVLDGDGAALNPPAV